MRVGADQDVASDRRGAAFAGSAVDRRELAHDRAVADARLELDEPDAATDDEPAVALLFLLSLRRPVRLAPVAATSARSG